ncbi:MAG TPA: methylmalonyl Co-A mutase-associated GTPase MeaB [Bacteroidales bacterium]|nr:methylmalonyl Co-A mutase-associated GTPase MeaB [Bacteroidales bacterium]HRZ49103.1 methylmalonyl Co-A mutase-associated GTPase MeaB [Bacteroidales bacterium]
MKEKPYKSALKVNEGIEQPPQFNEEARQRFIRHRRKLHTAGQYFEGIQQRNTAMFSQAITLVESTLPEHQAVAQEIIGLCLPFSGKSMRIGITGVPGVGKSTFIDAFGMHLVKQGHRVAVLAVDPSSERSGGSILGDKTRMEELSRQSSAFIRPSPSAGSLGGVARKTRESIIVCEAMGYDVILVETVGVGQSETTVYGMVDFFLLLMLAGAGDELQGIKRGIMEMCDAIFITKADGENLRKAKAATIEYKNALHLLPKSPSGWEPVTGTCSALTGEGIPEIWETIGNYSTFAKDSGYFTRRREEQQLLTIRETIHEEIENHFYRHPEILKHLPEYEQLVQKQQISGYVAARKLLDLYFSRKEAEGDPD